MRLFLSIVMFSILNISFTSFANSSEWNYSVDAGLKMSLSTFSNNWNGNYGGTFVWISNIDASIQRKTKWFDNEENLNISYGQTSIQDKDTKRWSTLEKSEDEIAFESITKLSLGQIMNPCFAIGINTQFEDDEEDNFVKYFNPIEYTESFGLTRFLGNKDHLSCNLRLSGALRQKIERNGSTDVDSSGVITFQDIVTKDGGVELATDLRWKLQKRFTLTSKSTIFQTFVRSNPHNPPENDSWKYPDIRWETLFTANVTSFLQFTYYFLLNYDREIDKKYRCKQTVGVGLSLSFSNE